MKNKEIEELLNTFKELINTYSPDTEPFTIDYDYEIKYSALESFLSYIEQLEKGKEDMIQYACDLEDKICNLNGNIKQLENNRDKAIEYIEKHFEKEYKKPKEELKHYNLKNCTYDSGLVVLGILKGDSDDK